MNDINELLAITEVIFLRMMFNLLDKHSKAFLFPVSIKNQLRLQVEKKMAGQLQVR